MLRSLPVLALLLALPALAGCLVEDCSFETTEVFGFDTVRADADALGDTLTVVFVQSPERRLSVFTRADLRPRVTDENVNGVPTMSVTYEAEGLELGEQDDPRAPRFATARQGDTLYVYAEGSLDLFTEACSPPEAYLRIDVLGVDAPAGVRAVRVTTVDVFELEAEVSGALRQLDAARPRPAMVA